MFNARQWLTAERPHFREKHGAQGMPTTIAELKESVEPRKVQHEAQFQRGLMQWWTLAHAGLGVPDVRLLMHIPNGGRRTKIEASILKGMGVRAGVPDLFLAVPRGNYAGLWLELKDGVRKQKARAEQLSFLDLLGKAGYATGVAPNFGKAEAMITTYLRTGSVPCD
jgi:hypothetical protein